MKLISLRVITANRGDLFSRWGLLEAIRKYTQSSIEVACLSVKHLPPGDFVPLAYGGLHNALLPMKALAAARRADVVVWTGGLDLQDDSSKLKLLHMLGIFAFYRLLGLRIVLLMQGAGPITTATGRWLARRILNRVTVALIRDRGSLKLLERIGSKAHLKVCHDGIFLPGFPGGNPTSEEIADVDRLTDRPQDAPLIILNVRLWFHLSSSWIPYQFAQERYRRRAETKMDRLVAGMAQEIQRLRRQHNARVVLVSMYEPEVEPWEDDLPFVQQLKQVYFAGDNCVRVLEAPIGIPAFFELMGRADLVVGMRLHSTLIALRAGVAAIHLAYTLKGFDIYADLGLSDLVLPMDEFFENPTRLSAIVDHALADPALKDRIATTVASACKINERALDETFLELAEERV